MASKGPTVAWAVVVKDTGFVTKITHANATMAGNGRAPNTSAFGTAPALPACSAWAPVYAHVSKRVGTVPAGTDSVNAGKGTRATNVTGWTKTP
ncbi:hypothetical protein DPMN_072670 [Dreissena polymorpha]|uniref:Uncharacterized protein n=1 Tax=Dreissena polymorpha TaxID=45954 RepID=A0A9D4BXQ0_DREPO|nr:hypothetical protein DPMN_072670 [Dreissena polymorpha]